jgi:hypothetical protein
MTTKRLRAMLDLAREKGLRVHCLPDGSMVFEPLLPENTVRVIDPNNPQGADKPVADDEEIIL